MIKIQVRDWDNATSDEIVGTAHLSLSDMKRVNWKTPRWVNIYGIPDVTINPGKETTIAKQMDEGHIAGTEFVTQFFSPPKFFSLWKYFWGVKKIEFVTKNNSFP